MNLTRLNLILSLVPRLTCAPIPPFMMLSLTILISATLHIATVATAMPVAKIPANPTPELSFLESQSIAPATYQNYRVLLQAFIDWCQRAHVNWNSSLELDNVLVAYFDRLYWHGNPCAMGSKCLAAVN